MSFAWYFCHSSRPTQAAFLKGMAVRAGGKASEKVLFMGANPF